MHKLKKSWLLLLAVLALPVAYYSYVLAAYSYQRFTAGGSQIYELYSDGTVTIAGPLKSSNNYTATSVTLPTTVTGSNFAHWVPVTNIGPAVVQGEVLIASNTGTGYVRSQPGTTALTTVVGVAAEAIASGAKGWMVPRGGGFAIVRTTGTVNIGDTIVSSATAVGYAGGTATPTTGTDFGTAMSAGTAAGGVILAILH